MSWESLGFSPHNPKVVGSNLAPATKSKRAVSDHALPARFFVFDAYLTSAMST
jgi:hypothetical protein